MDNPLSLITIAGAAGAFFYVLQQLIGGKLHTSSETDGLRQDKADLLKINGKLTDGMKSTNDLLAEVLKLLRERPDVDPE